MAISKSDRETLLAFKKQIEDRKKDLQRLVEARELLPQVAQSRMRIEFGEDYEQTLTEIQKLVAPQPKAAPRLAVLAAIPIVLIILGFGVTGLATVMVDQVETVTLNQYYTESGTIILPTQGNISSIRVSGWYSGTGSVNITYVNGQDSTSVFSIDALPLPPGAQLLNQRNLSFTMRCEDSCSMQAIDPHLLTISLSSGELFLEDIVVTQEVAIDVESEQGSIEQEEIVSAPIQELVIEEPAEQDGEEQPVEGSTQEPSEIENNTNQTNQSAPATIPDINLTPPAPNNSNETNQSNETTEQPIVVPETDLTPDEPAAQEPVQQDNADPEPIEVIPEVATPGEPIVEENDVNAEDNETNSSSIFQPLDEIPGQCSRDSDCGEGRCVVSRYQGGYTGYCSAANVACAYTTGVATPGEIVGENECVGNGEEALWMSQRERIDIQNSVGQTLALIDRYGNMAIIGRLLEGQSQFSAGWQNIADTTIAIDRATGNLELAGELTSGVQPAETGIVVRDTSGRAVASFQDNGNMEILGQILEDAEI